MTSTPNEFAQDRILSDGGAINLEQANLRANPAYELALLDRLSATEREDLRGLAKDPDCYGVLRPRADSTLSLKAVSRDTALLLFSLQEPGPLPRYAVRTMGEDCATTIGKMILDGVLEVEASGRMISGIEAANFLYGGQHAPVDEGSLAGISRRAVEYAASLGLSDPTELSARLYAYNRVPTSARWRALLPGDSETASYLGLESGPVFRTLKGSWRPLSESPAWIHWQATASQDENQDQPLVNYKLYVSPACDRMREAVGAVAEAVSQSGAIQWKVGKGLRGLLRPDKLVIYFNHFADLEEVALKIMTRLEGCAPQGVPFTAELAGDGLLSWGIDPPGERTVPWLEHQSWRSKLSNRLALALAHATVAQTSERYAPSDAVRFALQRLRLEGIDTSTWTPSPGFEWAA